MYVTLPTVCERMCLLMGVPVGCVALLAIFMPLDGSSEGGVVESRDEWKQMP